MKVCMCISWVSRYMCICWRQNVSSKSFSEIRSTHITTIHFFRNTYCFPQTSELQFPAQQPSADHSLITLLPITVVMPVEIDGGSQILEPLSIYMGAVIHSGWPTAVSKQPCVLLDNKQHTRVTITCSSGQQATSMHSDYLRVLQPRVLLDNKKKQHLSPTRVLLGNKHPVYKVIIHNVINMCLSNKHLAKT
jgi:hypothetical protein